MLFVLLFFTSCSGEQDDMIGDCLVSPDSDRICTEEYQPVCACNDMVYSNSCFAEKAGNLKWRTTTKGINQKCDY